MSDELVLTIDPPYIGSAVSPEVNITETTNDVTVTITDFRGEHSYSVEKTDQAIADAETAATNANTAAANATSTANAAAQYARDTADQAAADAQETADAAAGRADTAAASANQAAQSANIAAGTANTSAQNADAKAALADSKATLANQAATTANQAAQAAEAAKTAANTAAGQATTAAGNANTAAQTATTAASNADAKAQLADTAAANADTATQAANTATTNATNAAQAANNAADYAIEAADDMPKLVNTASGTTAQTVNDAWPTTPESAVLYGKSVQDGTPTPENPVPVEVVGGRNLFNSVSSYTKEFTGSSGDEYATVNSVIPGVNAILTAHRNEVLTLSADAVSDVPKEMYLYANKPSTIRQTFTLGSTPTRINITFTSETNLTFTLGSRDGVAATVTLSNVQIEQGTHATPYTPYGCIGLQTGETVTPIDLQGYTLAGGDVLKVDSAGRVWIDNGADVKVIDGSSPIWVSSTSGAYTRFGLSNQGNAKGNLLSPTAQFEDYLPNLDAIPNGIGTGNSDNRIYFTLTANETTVAQATAYLTAHPITVYYHTLTRSTIELGTIDLPELTQPCELAIYASLDPEWAISYEQDPNAVITSLQASIAPVESGTASTNYSVNSYLIHANQLYRVTSAIATGEAITPGSNCVACTVMGEVIRLTA